MVTIPDFILDHVHGVETHVRNLEKLGLVVTFTEPDAAIDCGWFVQVDRGDWILYQGPADNRFTGLAWGVVQGSRLR